MIKLSQSIYFTAGQSYIIYRPRGYVLRRRMDGWMCVPVGFVFRLFRAPVCFLSRSQFFFWLSWREFACVRASLCVRPCLCMTRLHSVKSKRPGWQIKLTTSSHTRPTLFFFFFFFQRWGLEGDNIGRVNIQFTTQPGRQKSGGKLLSRIFLMHSLHNSDIWKERKKRKIDLAFCPSVYFPFEK